MLLIIIIICFLLTLSYLVLMLVYNKGWRQEGFFTIPRNYNPGTQISIIIPARNEEANIGSCIESILEQNYPSYLFEIIVVDDHSEDKTFDIVKRFARSNIICLSLAEHIVADKKFIAYKKNAIALGVKHCKGDLVITTDADCIVPQNWLRYMAARYEIDKPKMIVAPVDYTSNKSLLHQFQSLDFMSMQGITVAANQLRLGNMCNGANLAFDKDAFFAVKGYDGIDHLSSGDDYLLMMKLREKYPGYIACLKSQGAIVYTAPQNTWASFFQQRIRWASKSGKYNDTRLTAILLLVYFFNLSFLVLLVAGFIDSFYWNIALLMLGWKVVVEMYFLFPVAAFFKKTNQLWYFPLLQPLHILYIITAGLMGFAGIYKWKGRVTK